MNDSSSSALYQKLTHYCSYQERCTRDVVHRLRDWKVPKSMDSKLIRQLKGKGYLDELRFARVFTRGKFQANQWGKVRIRYELLSRQIPENLITEAFQEIAEDEYQEQIRKLILKKNTEIKTEKNFKKREKIITFVVGKGYEIDLVLQVLEEIKLAYDSEGRH